MKSYLEIVPTNVNYNYTILQDNINNLQNTYKFLKIGNIGYSVLGKKIPYIKIGKGRKKVLYHAGIHANEWITSILLMKFIENFCKAYMLNKNIYSYSAKDLFNKTTLYIVPMVNPDGIDLVKGNISKKDNIYKDYINIAKSYTNIPFPDGWKANFNGVGFKNYQPSY